MKNNESMVDILNEKGEIIGAMSAKSAIQFELEREELKYTKLSIYEKLKYHLKIYIYYILMAITLIFLAFAPSAKAEQFAITFPDYEKAFHCNGKKLKITKNEYVNKVYDFNDRYNELLYMNNSYMHTMFVVKHTLRFKNNRYFCVK